MKTLIVLTLAIFSVTIAYSQDEEKVKSSDLSIPSSPAFVLTDLSPSIVQTPTAPKTFILGIMQSYSQSGGGFPQNYSAEFAPYWWFKPTNRSVYSFLGFKTDKIGKPITPVSEDIFYGLKFTTVSFALIKKDLIPDTIKLDHKVASVGFRTTLIRVHGKKYFDKGKDILDKWHQATLEGMDELQQDAEARGDSTVDPLQRIPAADEQLKKLTELVAMKPFFNWELAGAYATYGVNDSTWQTGRAGIWSTATVNVPLDVAEKPGYVSINGVVRYQRDNFVLDSEKKLSRVSSTDYGVKVGFEFKKLAIAYEGFIRYVNGKETKDTRSVGVINYRVADSVFITGAFGKNFNSPDALVALFGINWGFGSEALKLP